MKIFSTLFFCLLLACSSTASAQESFEVTPSRGLVTLSFGNTPRSNVDNLPGIFGSQWGGINAVVPVFRSFSAEAEGGSLNQLALTGSVRKNTMELPLTTSQRTISSLSLGASWTMLSGSRQVYSVSGGIGITEDRLITGSPEARFRLTALGSYRFSEPVLLLCQGPFQFPRVGQNLSPSLALLSDNISQGFQHVKRIDSAPIMDAERPCRWAIFPAT